MKKLISVTVLALIAGFFLLPLYSFAEDNAPVSAELSVIGRGVDGERDSAKFEEYREIPDGLSGDVKLKYQHDGKYYLDLDAKDIAEDDQYLQLKGGEYGKYRIEIDYDKLPHRFAYDAKTLYSGVGTGKLTIGDGIQNSLQASTSSADLAENLKSFYFPNAFLTDLELTRDTIKVKADIMALDPFNLRFEFSNEQRKGIDGGKGTRPFAGSFGFGNTMEIPEPIDYDTTQLRFIGEYAKKPYYLSASYYLSVFDNHTDTLEWDNPFRLTDSTNSHAYSQTYANGPSRGLTDLVPDNQFHQVSLTGSLMDLPLRSRLTANASWGWMRQDDNLKAYTTNTAIVPGAANSPPFDASDPSNLPTKHVNAKVDTSLYNVLLTSRPLNFMSLKARYRYYEYDNNTTQIDFPGYVRTDAVWENEAEKNLPTGYEKNTASGELGFDIFKATTLSLGYTFDKIRRHHREVAEQEDDIYKVAVDSKPLPWLGLRASYERAERTGVYDYTVPFEGEIVTAQLPWLRKYDEANRDRDRVQFLASVYPIEPLMVTGSFTYGKDDFKDSPFGLVEDSHNIFSIDADYALTERVNIYAFYTHEKYKSDQKARQWSPGSTGDPYVSETTHSSASNWTAESEDKMDTVGGGLKFALIPKKLGLDVSYSYAQSKGEIRPSSPVGSPDANDFVPVDFKQVDNTKLQTLHVKAEYTIRKGLSITLGYMWERFDIEDYETTGFEYVPTTLADAYNGATLMGALLKDYDVNVLYAKLTYRF